MISYFVGAIGKNATVNLINDEAIQDPLQKMLNKWKKDIVEQEKEEKITTFEGLGKFLEFQKDALMSMGGVYLEGDKFV